MKCLLQQKDLMVFMKRIQGFINNKNEGISNQFALEASKESNKIILTALDHMLTVRYSCENLVTESGKISIPTKKFFQFIKEMPSGSLDFKTNENIAEIKHQNIKCKINFNEFDESQQFTEASDNCHKVQVPIQDIKEMLHKVSYIVSKEVGRPILQGVRVTLRDNILEFVASDGKRLSSAWCKLSSKETMKIEYEHVIPIKCLDELERHIHIFHEGFVSFYLDKNRINISVDCLMLSTKVLEGSYPNIHSIIPSKKAMNKITGINKEEFIGAIKLASAFTSERSPSIKINISDKKMYILGSSDDLGEGETIINTDFPSTKDIKIGFHPLNLLDVVKRCKNNLINLYFTEPFSPCIITEKTNSYTLIMPMRIIE